MHKNTIVAIDSCQSDIALLSEAILSLQCTLSKVQRVEVTAAICEALDTLHTTREITKHVLQLLEG